MIDRIFCEVQSNQKLTTYWQIMGKIFCAKEFSIIFAACLQISPNGGIGRRAGLKIQ